MTIGQFKSDGARDKFFAAYDRVFDRIWSAPSTPSDIPTSFGTTRVYRVGDPAADGAPIVLLPGSGGNSLMWHRYLSALTERHPVIAVDTIGEAGASVQTAPLENGRDGAAWLEELLSGLDVTGAHVVGCSYGGWLALNHAIRHPERVAALTLLDPAGFAEVGWRFCRWVILGGLAGLAPRRLRPRLARVVNNSTILEADLMSLALPSAGFRRRLPEATVFTDDELCELRTPVSFLLGEHSALHDSQQVADRIAALVPDARVEIVPAVGHALPMDRPDLVTDRILRFSAVG